MTSRRPGVRKKKTFRKSNVGRKREGKECRQVIGASVRADTKRELVRITEGGRRRLGPDWNIGRTLDELMAFARRRKWILSGHRS